MSDERAVLPLLGNAFDYIWARTTARLDGIGRDEYLWEPAPGSWNVREVDGQWQVERTGPPDPEPAPVTTIAWRTWHIASDCLADYVVHGGGDWALDVTGKQWHDDPRAALADMQRAYDAFRAFVTARGEDGMWQPLGPDWGPYAQDTWAALVIHAFDEVAHHGAEIALLRDLYAAR